TRRPVIGGIDQDQNRPTLSVRPRASGVQSYGPWDSRFRGNERESVSRLASSGGRSGSVRPLRLRFLFHLEDASPSPVEFLFKPQLVERLVPVGEFQSNIGPVLRLQRIERGRKYDALLHCHVLPFVVDEVANDVGHILAHEILI